MKRFQSIDKLDEAALYVLELVISLSILLLAFGLFASVGNVLRKGIVLANNLSLLKNSSMDESISL